MTTAHINKQSPVALVTGASCGIGRAIALALAHDGWTLVLTDVDTATLQPTLDEIRQAGFHASAVAMDLNQPASFDPLIAHIGAQHPNLSLLVNNAGLPSLSKPALETQIEEWNHLLDVNLRGTFFLTLAWGRWITAHHQPGHVISLGSTHGSVGFSGASVYGITKAGIHHMTRMLAIEWAAHGIRVNAIAPGTTNTESRAISLADPQRKTKMLSRIPLGRLGEPHEMAAAVRYLASPQAAYITGQILHLDGGLTAQ